MDSTTLLNDEQIDALKAFVELLKQNPALLHDPKLGFFSNYLRMLGASLPPKGVPPPAASDDSEEEEEVEEEEEEPEAEEPEEEDPDLMEKDEESSFPPLYTAASSTDSSEIDEATQDKIASLKQKAQECIEDQKYDEALSALSEAVTLAPPTALIYTKRADILLKLKKPNACIRDCSAALDINPDSGKAYRIRGQAYRYTGEWEKAHQDIETGQKIDFDDSLMELEKLVSEKAKKLAAAKRKKELKAEEKAKKEKMKRQRRAKKAHQKAAAAAQANGGSGSKGPTYDDYDMGGDASGMGGDAGGMPGNASSILEMLMSDPEIAAELSDPAVAKAVNEVLQKPETIAQHMGNPAVAKVLQKVFSKLGGGGGGGMPGMPGGMAGGMPGGMPGGMGGMFG